MMTYKRLKFFCACLLTLVIIFMTIPSTTFSGQNNPTVSLGSDRSKGPPDHALGQVLVKFKRGITEKTAKEAISRLESTVSPGGNRLGSLKVAKTFPILSRRRNQLYYLLESGISASETMAILARNPFVAAVSLNHRLWTFGLRPNDPRFEELWALENTGQIVNGTIGTVGADIRASEAWVSRHDTSEVVVAVLDSGIDYHHEDLTTNIWTNPGEISDNGLDDDGNGYVDDVHGVDLVNRNGFPLDDFGHGTQIAGVIAAGGNNGLGITGIAWETQLMAVKIIDNFGRGFDAQVIEGLEYIIDLKANHGIDVRVINASWGGAYNQLIKDAIEEAGRAGIVLVAACGNSGMDLDVSPVYPASYDLDNIISVAASDQDDQLSGSNYGVRSVDIAAPGTNVLSTTLTEYTPARGDAFFDDMERGDSQWATGGTPDTWAITAEKPHSPTHGWSDSPGTDYQKDTDNFLAVGRDIDLSNLLGHNVYFGFHAYYDVEQSWDLLYLDFSKDSGETWDLAAILFRRWPTWIKYLVLVKDEYKTNHFRFRYHLVTDSEVVYDGVYVDDVGVGRTPNSNSYVFQEGTSLSAALVSGALALVASEYPTASAQKLIDRILAGADLLDPLTGYLRFGGRLNLEASLNPKLPARPFISSVEPSEGVFPGNQVTLSGYRFGEAEGQVLFDDQPATIHSWADTSITCFAPGGAGKLIQVTTTEQGRSPYAFVSAWETETPMINPRDDFAAVVYQGRIYALGGYIIAGSWSFNFCHVYDPFRKTWKEIANMPESGRATHAGTAMEDKIYCIGGYSEYASGVLDSVLAYDPAEDKWQEKASLPKALAFAQAVTLGGKVYLTGGLDAAVSAQNTLLEYDPVIDAWTTKAPMSQARYAHGAVAFEGNIYVFGGRRGENNLKSAEIYDPVTDRWSSLPDMPLAIARMGVTTDGTTIYSVGGVTDNWGNNPEHTYLTFNPDTQTWGHRDDSIFEPTVGKYGSELVYLNGSLYSLGGVGPTGTMRTIERLALSAMEPNQAVCDFNRDGKPDILYRHPGTGNIGVWLMDGIIEKTWKYIGNHGVTWDVKDVGDFNHDGKSDILYRHPGTGNIGVWLMNGTTEMTWKYIGNHDTAWDIRGVGDFNGDGDVDVLYRNSRGNIGVWLMNGTTETIWKYIGNHGAAWDIEGVGDFNNDGHVDVLHRNPGSGNLGVWFMDGAMETNWKYIGNHGTAWDVKSVDDFNSDGHNDILYRHSSGNVNVWLMNGVAETTWIYIGNHGVWDIR